MSRLRVGLRWLAAGALVGLLAGGGYLAGREFRGGSEEARAELPAAAETEAVLQERAATPVGTVRPEEECLGMPAAEQVSCLAGRYQAMEAEDWAKEPFRGQIGHFLVVPEGGRAADWTIPCDAEITWDLSVEDVMESELAFPFPTPAPGEVLVGTVCRDGGLVGFSVPVDVPSRGSFLARDFYVDELLPVPVRAPRERLLLTEIAGYEALVELPVIREPAELSRGRIRVIERLPEPGTPGIFWGMQYYGPVEEAVRFLEEMIRKATGGGA